MFNGLSCCDDDIDEDCNYFEYIKWCFSGYNYENNLDKMIEHHNLIGIFSDSGIKRIFSANKCLLLNLSKEFFTLDDFNENSTNDLVVALFKTLNDGNKNGRPILLEILSIDKSSVADIRFSIFVLKDESVILDCGDWDEYLTFLKSRYDVSRNIKKIKGNVVSIGQDMSEDRLLDYFK